LQWQGEIWVHQRTAAIHGNRLAGDKARFFTAKQGADIGDVGWRRGATHRCPPGLNPLADGLLHRLWRLADDGGCVADTRIDGVDRNPLPPERHGEVAAGAFDRCLGRTHAHPRLPATGLPARRVGQSQDTPPTGHVLCRRARPDEESACLCIIGHLPFGKGHFGGQGVFVDGFQARDHAMDKDVATTQLFSGFVDQCLGAAGVGDISLHKYPVRPRCSH
jgi:hypothetical protein